MILLTKQKYSHRGREETYGYQLGVQEWDELGDWDWHVYIIDTMYKIHGLSWWLRWSQTGEKSTCNVGELGLIPGLGRSPGEGNSYPLQYSGLENSMGCIVHRVTKSRTWLSDFHMIKQGMMIFVRDGRQMFLTWAEKAKTDQQIFECLLWVRHLFKC